MKINDITEKEFMFNTAYSSFYKVKVGEDSFILKETTTGSAIGSEWSLSNIIRSYENCMELSDIGSITKVYDFVMIDGKTLVLMEYLEGYENLINVVVPNKEYKDNIYNKIIELHKEIWNRGLINYDFTIINFMVKNESIKMIDLEFIDNVENMSLFRMLWFCERMDIIKNWHGSRYDEIMKIKKEVFLKWKSAI